MRMHFSRCRSEEWTHTLVDLKFMDTVSGDVLVALRNNRGNSLSTGPLEHFVSVHPRAIQQKVLADTGATIFDLFYGTSQDRSERQTLFKTSDAPSVVGFRADREQILAITDMFVLPTGKGDGRYFGFFLSCRVGCIIIIFRCCAFFYLDDLFVLPIFTAFLIRVNFYFPIRDAGVKNTNKNRQPWVFLSVVVAGMDEPPPDVPTTQDEYDSSFSDGARKSYTSITDSYRRDICINLNLDIFVTFPGSSSSSGFLFLPQMRTRMVFASIFVPIFIVAHLDEKIPSIFGSSIQCVLHLFYAPPDLHLAFPGDLKGQARRNNVSVHPVRCLHQDHRVFYPFPTTTTMLRKCAQASSSRSPTRAT